MLKFYIDEAEKSSNFNILYLLHYCTTQHGVVSTLLYGAVGTPMASRFYLATFIISLFQGLVANLILFLILYLRSETRPHCFPSNFCSCREAVMFVLS